MPYLKEISLSLKQLPLSGIVGLGGLLVLAFGCLSSSPLTEKEMDQFWQLSGDLVSRSTTHQLAVDGRTLPTRWTIRFDPNTERASAEIARAIESMQTGTERIDFSLSPAHTGTLAQVLADARMGLENLHRISQAKSKADLRLWKENLAQALVRTETIIRLVSQDTSGSGREVSTAPLGEAASPLLLMITTYLNEDAHGELLGELTANQLQELRSVLGQILLRAGFEMTGKQLPGDTLDHATLLMEQTTDLNALQGLLSEQLLEAYHSAAPLEKPTQLARTLTAMVTWMPRLLQGMEALILQWPKLEFVEFEIRYFENQPIFTGAIHVAAGEEVELARFSAAQPRLSFAGSTRAVFQLRELYAGETVVAFEPLSENGGVQLRFDGIVYGLTRLLAFPLDNGVLDEIRAYVYDPAQGDEILHVTMLMRDPSDEQDPRRLIVFQDTRRKEWRRDAFSLQKRLISESQVFNYIKPSRHYSFARTKQH